MNKLFLIRYENGNSLILQAESEQAARESAGLNIDPADYMKQLGASNLSDAKRILHNDGLGPQNATIRELNQFRCDLTLKDNGAFDLYLDSHECYEEVNTAYPALSEALLEHPFDHPQIKAAVATERARLTNPSDKSKLFLTTKDNPHA